MFTFAEIVRKYLALWVAIVVCLALVIGYHFPSVNALKKAIPFLLFFMLFPMMITLRTEDIARALKDLKLSVISILVNFLMAPLLGALWAHLLFRDTDPFLAAGFILKVAVPCSGMVAAWTGYAKGKVESALLIVALSLVLAVFFCAFLDVGSCWNLCENTADDNVQKYYFDRDPPPHSRTLDKKGIDREVRENVFR